MLSPWEIERLAAEVLKIYGEIESELLISVAKRFSVLEEIPASGLATWQIDKLQQLGALRQENFRVIATQAKKTETEIIRMLEKGGFKTLEVDEAIYKKAYKSGAIIGKAVPVYASPGVKQIIFGAVANMKQSFNLVNTTALQASQNSFMGIVNRAYLETSLGVRSYQDAIRTAVRDLADKGITGATYKSVKGRITNVPVDVAVRRAVLTGSSQMAGNVQTQRAKEWGANLVEVSSHMGARPDHALWQGKIYSLEGGTSKYPNLALSTGYGTVTGLCGVNCRHVFYPFFEGLSEQTYGPYDLEKNEREYELSQEQRALERDIRQQKNRILAADAIGDNETKFVAQLKLKEKEAKLNGFLERTGRTQRADRQRVYGFGRSQASRATWAAKNAPLPKTVKARDTFLQVALGDPRIKGIVPKGADITGVRVIAGANTSTILRYAQKLVDNYGGTQLQWQKKAGIINTIYFRYDVHWDELNGKQYDAKMKARKQK